LYIKPTNGIILQPTSSTIDFK